MAKKTNVVSGALKTIPENVKGYILLAGMGYAGYKIYQWYQKQKLESQIEEKVAEIKAYNKAGVIASFPDNQYVSWGNLINDELNSSFGIDEDKIFNIFRQLKNIVDLYKLQGAVTYTEGLVWKQTRTLDQALAYYLYDSDIDIINKILSSKNINYKFEY
jgi:hypothetical protein